MGGERERHKEKEREKVGDGRGGRGGEMWKRSGEMGHEGFMPLAVVGGWIASRVA